MDQKTYLNLSTEAKKLYSIGETAKLLGISITTLRRYEKEGRITCKRTSGGQRRFSQEDIALLSPRPIAFPTSFKLPPIQLFGFKHIVFLLAGIAILLGTLAGIFYLIPPRVIEKITERQIVYPYPTPAPGEIKGEEAPSVALLSSLETTAVNQIINSSFEGGNLNSKPKFWDYTGSATVGNVIVSNESVRTGTMGVKISESNASKVNPLSLGVTQSGTTTRNGADYTLSIYVRIKNLGGKPTLRLGFIGTASTSDPNYGSSSWTSYSADRYQDFLLADLPEDSWQRFTYTEENLALGKYPYVEIVGYVGGKIYLDDIELTEGSLPKIFARENIRLADNSIMGDPSGNLYPVSNKTGSLGIKDNRFESLYLAKGSIDSSGNLSVEGEATINKTLTVKEDLQVNQAATVSGNFKVSGDLAVDGGDLTTSATTFNLLNSTVTTLNIGGAATSLSLGASTGTTTINNALSVSGTSTFTKVPIQAHTGTWATGSPTWNVSDATVYINPATATADSNLLGLAVNGSVKFAVDAEGDIFGKNMVLEGTVTQGTTTVTGDLSVEGNTTLGDATTDTLTINPATLTWAGGNKTIDITAGDLTISTSGDDVVSADRWTIGSTTAGVGQLTVTGAQIGKALVIFNETGDQNILTASASGVTKANLDRSGNLAIEGQLSDLSDTTLTVNDALSVLGALTVTGVISDSDSNLVLDDTVDIGSGTTGIRVSTTGDISDIDGDISISDNTNITGNLDVSASGAFGSNAYIVSDVALWTYQTSTITSGSEDAIQSWLFANPSAASSALHKGIDIRTGVQGGNAQNFTGALYGIFSLAEHGGTAQVDQLYGSQFEATNLSSGTVVQMFGTRLHLYSQGASGTVNTAYSLYIDDPTVSAGSIGTNYGIYLESQTAGSTDIGLYIADADTYSLQLASTDGDAASGITFGTDTNLYRSAANTLRTNDTFIVDGNVGIGTTGPTGRLHITTTASWTTPHIYLEEPTYGNSRIAQSSVGSLAFRNYYATGANSAFAFRNSTDDPLMNLLANGNVGIGTTGPATPLHIYKGGDDLVLRLQQSDASYESWFEALVSDGGYARFGHSNASNNFAFFNTDADRYEFRFGGAIKTTMLSSGNVGIGTTSPTAKLDIAGDASASGSLVLRGTSPVTIDVLNGARLDFQTSVGGDVGLTPRMTILNSGNVGIGTTNPGAKLHIAASTPLLHLSNTLDMTNTDVEIKMTENISGNYGFSLFYDGNTSNKFIIYGIDASSVYNPRITIERDTMAVGIGTTAPNAALEVFKTTEQLRLAYDTNSYTSFTVASDSDLAIKPAETGQLIFQPTTDSTTFMQVLDADGGTPILNIDATNESVGIGTTGPKGLLHVASSSTVDDLILNQSSMTNLVINPSIESGTVGSTPDEWYTEGSVSFVKDSTRAYIGNFSGKFTPSGTNPLAGTNLSIDLAQPYTVSAYVYLESYTAGAPYLVLQRTDTYEYLARVYIDTTKIGQWQRVSATYAGGGSGTVSGRVKFYNSGSATFVFYADAVQLEQSSSLSPYADGSLGPGYSWSGTPHRSTSSRSAGAAFLYRSINSAGGLGAVVGGTSPALRIEQNGTGPIASFFNIATEVMRITASGSVGIGTTSPGGKLGLANANTYLDVDGSNNLTFTDANAGTKTLTQLTNTSNRAAATSNLTLTTTAQDVPGCSLSLGAGTWLVWGVFAISSGVATNVQGYLNVGGVNEPSWAYWSNEATAGLAPTASQVWRIVLTGTTTVKLQALKQHDVGTFSITATHTTITALRTGESGSDVAEYFPTYEDLESLRPGTLVSLDPVNTTYIKKSDKPYDKNLLGIVPTEPGMVIGEETTSNRQLVALAGRVPTLITLEGGNVNPGDFITSSSIPGYGMKINPYRGGPAVGIALEEFDPAINSSKVVPCPAGFEHQTCGKIMVFVNRTTHDPQIYLTDTGDLSIEEIASVDNRQFQLKNAAGEIIERVGAFAEAVIANLRTGSLETQTLSLNGKSLENYLSSYLASVSATPREATDSAQLTSKLDFLSQRVEFLEKAILSEATSSAKLTDTSSDLKLEENIVENIVFEKDLNVLGKTTLSDLGVTGNITAGLLAVSGLEGTIDTLSGPLKLQSLALGNLEIMGGKIIIDTSGNLKVEGEITAKKYNVDISNSKSASLGKAVLPAGKTQVEIQTSVIASESAVFVTPETLIDLPLTITSREPSASFTVEIAKPQEKEIKFSWWVVN